eukprot:COSAG02_NODE_99_length_37069_cov_24.910957_24_plen_1416_part_00
MTSDGAGKRGPCPWGNSDKIVWGGSDAGSDSMVTSASIIKACFSVKNSSTNPGGASSRTSSAFIQPKHTRSATTLAPGWVCITCAIFLTWTPRAIPDFVASSPTVSELYWGEKCLGILHVCPKIANLGPHLHSPPLGRTSSTHCPTAALARRTSHRRLSRTARKQREMARPEQVRAAPSVALLLATQLVVTVVCTAISASTGATTWPDANSLPSLTSVPRVRNFSPGAGGAGEVVEISSGSRITVMSDALKPHAAVLADELLNLAGIATTVGNAHTGPAAGTAASFEITLRLNSSVVEHDNEYFPYTLVVGTTGVTVTAGSLVGVAHGTATLLQSLRPNPSPGSATLAPMTVSDYATVEWTGFMYDLARDPVDILTLKSLIELARFYKMRYLHIFATAEQGWRLPIPLSMSVDAPVVFEGLVCYFQFHSASGACNSWHSTTDNNHLNLSLAQRPGVNGTWTIRAPPGLSLAGAMIDASIFYFGQQHYKPTDKPTINITKTDSQITITTRVNGILQNLWWHITVKPNVAPRPFGLSSIAADGAKGCPSYKADGEQPWCNSSTAWDELGEYAEARGVTLLPGVEIVGHNTLPAEVFRDPVELGCTNLASDLAIEAVKLLLDSVLLTFPTTPVVHIGWDEVSTDKVAQATTAPGFCKKHGLTPCSEAVIVDHFITDLNEYIRNKTAGKVRLMAYENVNTNGTANHTIITQPWWINGGNGYLEDQQKSNLHGNQGLTTMQTAWKPRVYTPVHGVFDHSVAGTIYTHTDPQPAPPPPKCTGIQEGVRFNNSHYVDTNGPRDAKNPAECCEICSQAQNCAAWSFQVDPQFNETTCRWAHLTYCCWLHADASNSKHGDPTFKASGLVPHATKPKKNMAQGYPIPVNKQLLGAEMVLWETQRGQQDKVGFLRYKAPALAENTYSYGNDATSYYSSFARTFAHLDGLFSAVNAGFRLLEEGLTKDLGDIFRTDTETSMDYILSFAETLTLTLVVNRQNTIVRYTNSTFDMDESGLITGGGSGEYATNSSTPMPPTLSFNASSPELGEHGFIAIHAQAFDMQTGQRVGEPVVRRYWFQPFSLVVAGTMRNQDLAGEGSPPLRFGPHLSEIALFSEGVVTIALTSSAEESGCSSVRYAIAPKNVTASSPALPVGSQLIINGSTDTVSIACFEAFSGARIGRVWAAHFTSNLDSRIFGGNTSALAPLNAITVEQLPTVQRWELPPFIKPGNITKTLREWMVAAGISGVVLNTSVKLTATVVGGGGDGGVGSDGGGGGAGGIATETYYNILTCFPMTIEVGGPGEQSSLAFDDGPDGYRSPGSGRDVKQKRGVAESGSAVYPIRTTQDPIYPTVALPGTNGIGATSGQRGSITKGDPTVNNAATDGSPSTPGKGGVGWTNGTGSGGDGGSKGKGGAVYIVIELLSAAT